MVRQLRLEAATAQALQLVSQAGVTHRETVDERAGQLIAKLSGTAAAQLAEIQGAAKAHRDALDGAAERMQALERDVTARVTDLEARAGAVREGTEAQIAALERKATVNADIGPRTPK